MNFDSVKTLDTTSWQLLEALQEDARLSYAELGRRVGLSPPAAAERIKRMEEMGIIAGYRVEIDAEKIGLPITALIALTTTPQQYPQVISLMINLVEIQFCHHVTGDSSFIMEARVSSIAHLEKLIEQLSQYGQTKTSIVLSSPIMRQKIVFRSIP
ncbi:MAG: Lrp/AsnC family transcriptional regulator [Xenococcaceae cyanobacterium MO_188.B29]|nr:Lrp/AsnC family transcriptional regulator [Xenococcaceae cyanobacterium MO_188.B29]